MNPSQPAQPDIDLSKTAPFNCSHCNNNTFEPAFIFRKVSRFTTGATQDQIVPIQVFLCTSCKSIPDEFIPPFIKEELENK